MTHNMADKRSAVVALLLVLAGVAAAFVVSPQPASSSSSSSRARGCSAAVAMKAGSNSGGIGSRQASIASRREALLAGAGSVLASGVLLGSLPKPAEAASAASTYYPQVLAGFKELVALDGPEWAATKEKGGDEVRRRLGYVGTKSPLFKIQKAFKAIQDELLDGDGTGADPLEFADASQRVLDKIKDADFLAYSNNFSSYGNGGGGTDYLEESHKAIKPALEAYKEIIDMLKLQ